MTTLDDLISELTKDGKRPDEFRVRDPEWPSEGWFRPYFKDNSNDWVGQYESGITLIVKGNRILQIYTEPKPKVKRAQYLVFETERKPYLTHFYYKDDEEILTDFSGRNNIKVKRLDHTKIECDE